MKQTSHYIDRKHFLSFITQRERTIVYSDKTCPPFITQRETTIVYSGKTYPPFIAQRETRAKHFLLLLLKERQLLYTLAKHLVVFYAYYW